MTDTTTRSDCITEAARLVARQPGAVQRLRDAHIPDAHGSCHGCHLNQHPTPTWPCVFVAIAERALDATACECPARSTPSGVSSARAPLRLPLP